MFPTDSSIALSIPALSGSMSALVSSVSMSRRWSPGLGTRLERREPQPSE